MGLNTHLKKVPHHSPEGIGTENTDLSHTYSDSHPIETNMPQDNKWHLFNNMGPLRLQGQGYDQPRSTNYFLSTRQTYQSYRSRLKRPQWQGVSTVQRFELISQS